MGPGANLLSKINFHGMLALSFGLIATETKHSRQAQSPHGKRFMIAFPRTTQVILLLISKSSCYNQSYMDVLQMSDILQSADGVKAIVRAVYKRIPLATVSNVYQDFLAVLNAKRGQSETFKNFEARFELRSPSLRTCNEIGHWSSVRNPDGSYTGSWSPLSLVEGQKQVWKSRLPITRQMFLAQICSHLT